MCYLILFSKILELPVVRNFVWRFPLQVRTKFLVLQHSSVPIALSLRTKEAGPGQKGNVGPGLAEGWCLWVCAESYHRQVASDIGPH